MLLVPRQLMRSGMTGDVPYYGGRFTPAQAYAASHPRSQPPAAPAPPPPSPPPPPPAPAPRAPVDNLAALSQLLDTGVITPEEYEQLRGRAGQC